MVDFTPDDTPQLKAWRAEVRAFLEEALPGGFYFDYDYDESPERWEKCLAFWQAVGRKGWTSLSWPTEYYGQGRSAIERYILQEEFCNYAAPNYPVIGLTVASALLRHGTPEQRRVHLKGIAEATVLWGEGYSEPESGSDLASLRTMARRDGDGWVLNGQKTLGTAAHMCHWMVVLARTDPTSERHHGISCFMVKLDTPGITMLPLENMADGRQNQTFFDDVRLPGDALLGTEGEAWNEIWFGQGGEDLVPAGSAPDIWQMRIERQMRLLRQHCETTLRGGRPLIDDPVTRLKLAELYSGVELLKLHSKESYAQTTGSTWHAANPVSSVINLGWFKEFWPHFCQTYMEILGPEGMLSSGPDAPKHGHFEHYFRASFGNHAGGTAQLKRMTMATRGLGLPR